MKCVLISICPKWVEKIINGQKTIEVRKTKPNLKTPFKCYIYCTKKERLLHIFHKGEYIFCDDHSQGKFTENIFVKNTYEWQGKVIGEFTCDKTDIIQYKNGYSLQGNLLENSCLTANELLRYGNKKDLYGWHISNLKIYDKPKELSEFKANKRCLIYRTTYGLCGLWQGYKPCEEVKCDFKSIKSPPRSWYYIEE